MSDLDEKHDIRDAEFFVNGTPWLQTGLFELGLQFHHETLGERNLAERIFQVIKRRTEPFYNNFSNPDPETVDSWLKALAWGQNGIFEQRLRTIFARIMLFDVLLGAVH